MHAIDDMNHDERQVQSDGQIKSGDRGFHGSKGLHQVIGFMNEQYLAELKTNSTRRSRRCRTPTVEANKCPTPSACCKTSTSSHES
ncbi:MAG: hypothetical protein ACLS6O_08575 [Bifidobacterium sp.]